MEGFYFGISRSSFRCMGDEQSRGPQPQVSDGELLEIFREAEDPALTATEVAGQVSIARRSVYDRLKKLEDSGELRSKKVGGRTTVWWYPGHTDTVSK